MTDKVKSILEQLTTEEKAEICVGASFWHLYSNEAVGIPQVMVSDGPHGLRKQQDKATDHLGLNESISAVCFPAACATAASFDEALLERMGDALGAECRTEDVSVLLGPAVNIKRSPLCGRNFEYFSEDPYLTGKLAAAQIRGVQKWDVGTSLKHFAANNQEYHRQSCSSEVDMRTFREIYLHGFEIAVKEAKPWTVMCAYNKINGTYASENKLLLTDILRDEWGFDGCVMSDWGAVNDRVQGLSAGLDLEMPASGGYTTQQIIEAVKNGSLPTADLDKAVARILTVIFRYADAQPPKPVFDREKHHRLAAEIEKECAVLLKNDGALPLKSEETVAYIGEFAEKPRYQGGGSSHIHASCVVSALAAAKAQNRSVCYAKGFSATEDIADETLFAEAVQMAEKADKVVVFAGLPDLFESEGYDRTHMQLPACQNTLIAKLAALGKKVVVVLHNGSPVEMPWVHSVHAILEMYLGGQGVGEAADALLFGDANPCGRLPETFPLKLSDNPSYLHFPGYKEKVNYAEGVYVGYRYYDTKEMPVLYPFGHGLSYTEFAYGTPVLSENSFKENGKITVSVTVKNTGQYFGKETVQLYIRDNTHKVGRPDKELKGFQKIALDAGESRRVEFTVDAQSLSYYDVDLQDWYAHTGAYDLIIARSAQDIAAVCPITYTALTPPYFEIHKYTTFDALLSDARTAPIMQARLQKLSAATSALAGGAFPKAALKKMAANVPLTFLQSMLKLTPAQLEAVIAQLKAQVES